MTAATHEALHNVCHALHRASEAVAEELERTGAMRGGPEAEKGAADWIARNREQFAELCLVKYRMLTKGRAETCR